VIAAEDRIMKVHFIDYVTIPNSLVSFHQTIQVMPTEVTVPRIGEKVAGFKDGGPNEPVFEVIDVIYMIPEYRIVVYLDFVKYV
jgi:hypothetical protein